MKLSEIAKEISEYYKKWEEEKKFNLYCSSVQVAGSKIKIATKSFHKGQNYSKDEMIHYLNWLKEGNEGLAFTGLKDYKPENLVLYKVYNASLGENAVVEYEEFEVVKETAKMIYLNKEKRGFEYTHQLRKDVLVKTKEEAKRRLLEVCKSNLERATKRYESAKREKENLEKFINQENK